LTNYPKRKRDRVQNITKGGEEVPIPATYKRSKKKRAKKETEVSKHGTCKNKEQPGDYHIMPRPENEAGAKKKNSATEGVFVLEKSPRENFKGGIWGERRLGPPRANHSTKSSFGEGQGHLPRGNKL